MSKLSSAKPPVFENPDLNILVSFLLAYMNENFSYLNKKLDRIDERLNDHDDKLRMLIEMVGGHHVDIQVLKDAVSGHADLHKEHEKGIKLLNEKVAII